MLKFHQLSDKFFSESKLIRDSNIIMENYSCNLTKLSLHARISTD